jgi:disulfide bond formation protein DsbB
MRNRLLILISVIVLGVSACGGDDDGADDGNGATTPAPAASAAEGQTLFDATCKACHAEGGVGIDGLGKPLANSDFIKGMSDADLVAFIKVGRGAADPENITGVSMPAKGGNPSLSDADLDAIVAYLRTLN